MALLAEGKANLRDKFQIYIGDPKSTSLVQPRKLSTPSKNSKRIAAGITPELWQNTEAPLTTPAS